MSALYVKPVTKDEQILLLLKERYTEAKSVLKELSDKNFPAGRELLVEQIEALSSAIHESNRSVQEKVKLWEEATRLELKLK